MWAFRRRRFPHVSVRRTWGVDGRPAWEFRFSSHEIGAVLPAESHSFDQHEAPPPYLLGQDDEDEIAGQSRPGRHRPGTATIVSSLGVQIDDDGLRIDEHHYRIKDPAIDAGESLHQPDIAAALAELAADAENEVLCDRVVSRLAVAHGWFLNAPSLDVSSARISGIGIGELLEGVFVWRAQAPDETFTYIVTPDLQGKELLKADPTLTRLLIRLACPHPRDTHSELAGWLREALGRLAAVAGAHPVNRPVDSPAVGAVLEIRDAEVADRPVGGGEADDRAGEGRAGERGPDPADRALSEELAELARKVGARAPRPAVVDLDAAAARDDVNAPSVPGQSW
jgi:hypothetical protein